MGTVNYCASDYITLAVEPYDVDNFLNDPAFRAEYPDADRDFVYDVINDYYGDDEANVETILRRLPMNYYHVIIKWGYYEGFSIDIENNFGLCYDSYEDKREAQKEITQLKKALVEMAGCGLKVCSPGWCTSYGDYNATIRAINRAVRDMREEVRTIPTWTQYAKEAGWR